VNHSAWWGFANASDRDRLEAFLRRAGKSGYQAGLHAVAELCDCEQADDRLFRALRDTTLFISFIDYCHLSAVPVAVYIITYSPPRLLLSMDVILCVAYGTKTVFR